MRRGKKKQTALEVISEGAKKSVLSQTLLISQVLFHPISQTWLYFKAVLQEGVQLNLGELSRLRNILLSALTAEPPAGAQGFPIPCFALWSCAQSEKDLQSNLQKHLGGDFPQNKTGSTEVWRRNCSPPIFLLFPRFQTLSSSSRN